MRTLLELFSAFFKIGICTFGGGYAMIPLIEAEAVEKRKWISAEEMLDIIAVAEATPGPLAINTATFVGRKTAGLPGAAAATLGTVLPSYLIIILVSLFYRQFRENRWVDCAFRGIRAAVVALMVNAVVKLARHVPKIAFAFALFGLALAAALCTDISVVAVLLAAGTAGVGYQVAKSGRWAKK